MDTQLDLSEFEHYNEMLSMMDISDCDMKSEILCPPPIFDLPPPPPPPWLDMPPLCDNCDSVPDVTSVNNVQDIFKNVIVITVMAISIIISIITITIILRRRLLHAKSKNTSAENLTSVSPDVSDKQMGQLGKLDLRPGVAGGHPMSPQNYYTRDHHIIVDQNGHTIIVPAMLPAKLNMTEADAVDNQPIYESIDSDVYSDHYSSAESRSFINRPIYNRGDLVQGSLYENPDASLYNANTTLTDASYQYQDVNFGASKTLPGLHVPDQGHPQLQGFIIPNMSTTMTVPIKTEVRLQSFQHQPYHISPL